MVGLVDAGTLIDEPILAAALGNMVVAWAKAETALSVALSAVSGMDLNVAMFGYYRIPTFEARTKYIRSLIPHVKDSKYDLAAIDFVVTKLNGLAKARNHWIHGNWVRDDKTKELFILDYRSPENERSKPVKAQDVINHVVAVHHRTNELSSLTAAAIL